MNRTYSDVLFPQESANESSEENGSSSSTNSINVGWLATEFDVKEDLDRSVAKFSSDLGNYNYNFVAYPIGGVHRAFWKYAREASPPPIHLPDLQLANSLWETYICGRISPWIDCDAEDEQLARLSEDELLKELNYVSYLGLRTIIVELKRMRSPRFSHVLNKWLWTKHSIFSIWVQLPPSVDCFLDFDKSSDIDLWTVWSDFRKSCAQYTGARLKVCIRFSPELADEFIEDKLIDRWNAEPVGALVVDSSCFITGKSGFAELPTSHRTVLQKIWISDVLRILLNQTNDLATYNLQIKREYSQELRKAVQDIMWLRRKQAGKTDGFLAESNIDYYDVVQAPLQPLSDNLDSGIYNTFEQDPIKYQKYGEAVEQAIIDLCEIEPKPRHVIVYLLGGGRGPLGTQILEAESRYNRAYRKGSERKLRVKLYVVEKNTNAIVTLKYINEKGWLNRATIIESDMRSLPTVARERNLEQPDIIVSELLGSFGDNELSPECLDGVTSFLKPTTISIPQKYTSYAAPIMSLFMYQEIKSLSTIYWNKGICGHGRLEPVLLEDNSYSQEYPQGHVASRLDQIYVVYLKKFCALADTKEVFTFEHPNFENSSNERRNVVEFKMDRRADMMGFAGYFDMVLYKDIMLSIEPKTLTPSMISWFPAVIPLRDLVRVDDGDTVRFIIDRKIDANGVWYEWCAEIEKPNGEKFKTVLQNENGESYYMRM